MRLHTRAVRKSSESLHRKLTLGEKKPCCTGDSNPRQYCAWLFSPTLYQLSYSCCRTENDSKMLCTNDIVKWNQRRTIATAVGSQQRWNNDSETEVGEPFPSLGIATSTTMPVEWNYDWAVIRRQSQAVCKVSKHGA